MLEIYLFIEGIALDHFSATTHQERTLRPKSFTHNDVFDSFLYDTVNMIVPQLLHTEKPMELLNKQRILSKMLSTLW